MERTRNTTRCPLFGEVCDLKENMLPTYAEVMKCYEWTRLQLKSNKDTQKEPTFQEIAIIVTDKIERLWVKASLPIVSHTRVTQMLQAYHTKCKKLLKSHPKIPKKNLEEFQRNGKSLFDISACKCKDLMKCTCPKERKVPIKECDFLLDQRTSRKMFIGNVDISCTKQATKTLTRKLRKQEYVLKHQATCCSTSNTAVQLDISTSTDSSEPDCDDKTLQLKENIVTPTTNTRTNYSIIAKTCDRYGVSDRAGAAIASAVLQATSSTVSVIDKNKLRRERTKTRQKIIASDRVSQVPALYFDGRKDKTLVMTKKGGKNNLLWRSTYH